MEVCPIGTHQKFDGIKISRRMPKEIVKAIKSTPAIKKAGASYSLRFLYNHKTDNAYLDITSPSCEGIIGRILAPRHSRKNASFNMGKGVNAILDSIEDIGATPTFFVEQVGMPRSFKQKLTALIEACKIALMPEEKTVIQEAKLHKILSKYENMNIPQYMIGKSVTK